MPAESQYGIPAAAAVRPGHPALVLGPEVRTYGDLDDRARRAADALSRLGVARGDRVGVMLPNSFEWFEVVHGAGRLGAVAVPVNIHFKAAETGWVLNDSGCRAVVVTPELAGSLADVADIPRLVVGDGYEEALAAAGPGGRRVDTAGPGGRPVDAAGSGSDDGAPEGGDAWPTTMVYTSGTTGRPKGVVPGGDDLRRTAAGMAGMGARWGFGPGDVHLLVGPAYHSGPAAFAQAHLALGATVVIMPRWDAESCLALIQDQRVTNTHMVPSNFIRILDLDPKILASYDLSSLRVVLHAAAPCPVPVKRAFMDLVGPEKVFEYFGATEGGGTAITPQEWLEHPGSVGRAIGGNEIVILDDEGRVLGPEEVGLVFVRPESAPFRYHRDDEKTSAAFKGERFTVGDMGYLDKDGYLFLTDRRADMVITGGVNVYPREIEDVLYLHPDVADCAVYGVADERWGEALKAVVQPRAGASLSTDDVVAWCRARLADYKRPRLVAFVDELPRDPNGKIAKHRLRAAEA